MEFLGVLVIVASIIATICASIWLIIKALEFFSGWHEYNRNIQNSARMKFSTWLDLYYVNKDAWVITDTHVCRYLGRYNSERVNITFSFFDYFLYRRWYVNREKEEKRNRNDKNLIRVLEAAQSDIEKAKKKAAGEMEEAKATVEEVSTRIKNATYMPPTESFDYARSRCGSTLNSVPRIDEDGRWAWSRSAELPVQFKINHEDK